MPSDVSDPVAFLFGLSGSPSAPKICQKRTNPKTRNNPDPQNNEINIAAVKPVQIKAGSFIQSPPFVQLVHSELNFQDSVLVAKHSHRLASHH